MVGFYVMTILAGFVIASSSVEYLGVSVTSSTCKAILHDPSYSGLSCFNEEVVLIEGYKLNISLSCKANNTLWKALKADSAFSTNSLSKIAKLSEIKKTVREKVGAVKGNILNYQREIEFYKKKAMHVEGLLGTRIEGLVELYLNQCSSAGARVVEKGAKALYE
ncbi:unnamed protein product [Cylicostephanus goldi]|uniref:Uncharacterized protein n=1 Tax=Cylicostephanus goldi TaxID=71465 RepID=A0A3P7QEQ3_CYLGO|nr:unnamed protein product [Cylicostephanus goldi]